MLGEIAKTFGRNFLVSCLVPAAAWVSANLFLWRILYGLPVASFFESLESTRGLIVLFGILLLSLAISVVQNQLIRIFEGYEEEFFRNFAVIPGLLIPFIFYWVLIPRAWMISGGLSLLSLLIWLAHPLSKRRQRALYKSGKEKTGPKDRYDFARSFPEEDNILPTRLGNCIRAFENHAALYGIEPITTWFRLLAVIPKGFQEQIGAAEANFSAILNLSAVSFLLAIELAGIYITSLDFRWARAGLVVVLVAYGLYRFACAYAAQTWGEYVRSAFDLYRLDLLCQLGVEMPSAILTLAAEQKLWFALSNIMLFGEERPDYPLRFTKPCKDAAPADSSDDKDDE
jgi:hypothetical protein